MYSYCFGEQIRNVVVPAYTAIFSFTFIHVHIPPDLQGQTAKDNFRIQFWNCRVSFFRLESTSMLFINVFADHAVLRWNFSLKFADPTVPRRNLNACLASHMYRICKGRLKSGLWLVVCSWSFFLVQAINENRFRGREIIRHW